jgi:hypothetical protein
VAFNGGKGLAVAGGKLGNLLQLGKTGKDARQQSIGSKEYNGAWEDDLTKVGWVATVRHHSSIETVIRCLGSEQWGSEREGRSTFVSSELHGEQYLVRGGQILVSKQGEEWGGGGPVHGARWMKDGRGWHWRTEEGKGGDDRTLARRHWVRWHVAGENEGPTYALIW